MELIGLWQNVLTVLCLTSFPENFDHNTFYIVSFNEMSQIKTILSYESFIYKGSTVTAVCQIL